MGSKYYVSKKWKLTIKKFVIETVIISANFESKYTIIFIIKIMVSDGNK